MERLSWLEVEKFSSGEQREEKNGNRTMGNAFAISFKLMIDIFKLRSLWMCRMCRRVSTPCVSQFMIRQGGLELMGGG
jgi:hypothetical protein